MSGAVHLRQRHHPYADPEHPRPARPQPRHERLDGHPRRQLRLRRRRQRRGHQRCGHRQPRQPRHGLRRPEPAHRHDVADVRYRQLHLRRAGQPDPRAGASRIAAAQPGLLLRHHQPPDQRQDRRLRWHQRDRPGLRPAGQPGQQERRPVRLRLRQPPAQRRPGDLPLRRLRPPGPLHQRHRRDPVQACTASPASCCGSATSAPASAATTSTCRAACWPSTGARSAARPRRSSTSTPMHWAARW